MIESLKIKLTEFVDVSGYTLMESQINLLMLEDSPDDAMLIQKTLQRAELKFNARVVSSRKEFVKALKSFVPDLILSDHQLPQFSSTEALEVCRKQFPFVPFILVTGAVSEEFAASIIRDGADDYLLKNSLKRLPTAIRQAIKRKKTESLLAESIERYELVSMATSDAIWDCNIPEDRITWNHGLKTLFGYESRSEEGLAKIWKEKIHPDDYERVMKEIQTVFEAKGDSWVSSYRYKHLRNHYRYVFDRARILYEKGKPVRMIGAMQDVDDQVRTMDEVRLLSIVASKTDSSVMILDRDIRIEWVNESFTRLTGYTLSEVMGKRPFEFLHGPETDREATQNLVKRSAHKPYTDDILNYAKNGRKYWVRNTVTPIFNADGKLDRFVTIQSDITEKKLSEEEMKMTHERLLFHLENAPLGFIEWDNQLRIKAWSKRAEEIFGWSEQEIEESQWQVHDKVYKEDLPWVGEMAAKLISGEVTQNRTQHRNYTKSGGVIWCEWFNSVLKDKEGKVVTILSLVRDITEQKATDEVKREKLERLVAERTRELNEALKKEMELVELKSKFVSIASHEFRTPLSTISFAAESIRSYFHQLTADEIQRKLLKIEDQASHMTNLLDDILTLGKSEAGKIKVKVVSLDLKEFVDSLIEEVSAAAKDKRLINFVFSCANKKVNVDDKLLRNIVSNLLTNALKFSSPPSPVSISLFDSSKGFVIEVTDEGIGIDEGELKYIFESFQRGSNAANTQGTGLGLSILKKAVELLGGLVNVKSKINQGSTFTVEIPVRIE